MQGFFLTKLNAIIIIKESPYYYSGLLRLEVLLHTIQVLVLVRL